ncbi:hypothetical protein GCM10009665_50510 [Kitasatospora nipponensis]|uniref:Ig-like domain-containing protein n=1 Tax=Kitasatospora nipponensis TaxID=258049 RepID=A0ABN1WPF2_9ACTN
MLRRLSFATAAAAASTALLAGAGPAMAAADPAASATARACSGVVQINSLAFQPAQVSPGQGSTATLTATNCTGQAQTVSETWYGRFTSATGGFPQGCPVVDPFLRTVAFAAHQRVAASTSYLVLAGCQASAFTVTVTLSQNGVQLGQASAVLTIG